MFRHNLLHYLPYAYKHTRYIQDSKDLKHFINNKLTMLTNKTWTSQHTYKQNAKMMLKCWLTSK